MTQIIATIPEPTRLHDLPSPAPHKHGLSNAATVVLAIAGFATPHECTHPYILRNSGKTLTSVVHRNMVEFFSYDTRVAVLQQSLKDISSYNLIHAEKKYSVTTTRHVNWILEAPRNWACARFPVSDVETKTTQKDITQYHLNSVQIALKKLAKSGRLSGRDTLDLHRSLKLLAELGYHTSLSNLCGRDERVMSKAAGNILTNTALGRLLSMVTQSS